MTGPLAPLFAQLEKAIEDAFRIELDECCTGPRYEAGLVQERDERLAALSAIKRHVQDMETALRQASECCARPPGVCFDPAALPAREKGTK